MPSANRADSWQHPWAKVPTFWGVVPTLGSAILPWRHLGKVLTPAEWGGKILLVIAVVDGIFSRTVQPLLHSCIPKHTGIGHIIQTFLLGSHPQTHIYTLMVIHLTQTHPNIPYRSYHTDISPWLPGSLPSRNPPEILQGSGRTQGEQDLPLARELGLPRDTGGHTGCPRNPLPAARLRLCHPLLCASVSPLGSMARAPGCAGRSPGPVALRAGSVLAVPRGAALHHQQAQPPGEREGRGRGGGEERAPRGPRARPRAVH